MTSRRLLIPTLLLSVAAFASFWLVRSHRPQSAQGHVAEIYRPSPHDSVPCDFSATPRPYMVQVLGQSNAGNHGAISREVRKDEEAMFFFEGHCYRTNGAAPGATGRDANLWTVLAPRLTKTLNRPVVFSVLAVEATRIADWAEPGEFQSRLLATLADNREHAFVPDVVIWQQGEADALAGTGMDEYRTTFSTLIALLRREGVTAPILAGISTRCRNDGSENVRSALKAVSRKDPTVRLGADTDVLTGQYRVNGCHFAPGGLQAAADLWLPVIVNGYR